jgi:hypothetical protein
MVLFKNMFGNTVMKKGREVEMYNMPASVRLVNVPGCNGCSLECFLAEKTHLLNPIFFSLLLDSIYFT